MKDYTTNAAIAQCELAQLVGLPYDTTEWGEIVNRCTKLANAVKIATDAIDDHERANGLSDPLVLAFTVLSNASFRARAALGDQAAPEPERCPTCKGTGRVYGYGAASGSLIVCAPCGGTGNPWHAAPLVEGEQG